MYREDKLHNQSQTALEIKPLLYHFKYAVEHFLIIVVVLN